MDGIFRTLTTCGARGALALVFAAGLSASAQAGPPAAIPEAGSERAEQAFRSFADQWMQKIRGEAHRQRGSGTTPGVVGASYREYGDDVQLEFKPTGHPTAPYVGILRYKEQLYKCTDAKAERCSLSAVTPVTEIFRFQDGRWIY